MPWCCICCCGDPAEEVTALVVTGGATRIRHAFSRAAPSWFISVDVAQNLTITAVTQPNVAPTHANVVWPALPPNAVVNGHVLTVPRAPAGGPFLATAAIGGSSKSVNVYLVEIATLVCENGTVVDPVTWSYPASPGGRAEITATPNPDAGWFRNDLPWVWNTGLAGRSHRRRRLALTQVGDVVVTASLYGVPRSITVRVLQIEAVLQVERLTFTGGHPVECDSLGNFDDIWAVGRAAPAAPINAALTTYNAILCYTRNTPVTITARFTVTQMPYPAENVTIRGTANFNGTQLRWTSPVVNIAADAQTVTVNNVASDVNLPDEVREYANLVITWELVANGIARPIGQTTHTLYATLGAPIGAPAYWTLLEMSCVAAGLAVAPVATANALVAALAAQLALTVGDGNGFRRCRDDQRLSYWAMGRTTPQLFTTLTLMQHASGTGRCNAWAELFIDVCRIHGIVNAVRYNVRSVNAGLSFLVETCAFNGPGNPGGGPLDPFTHTGNVDCVKGNGLPGQGKSNPQFTFIDHAMVEYGGQIYDPSYGAGPFGNHLAWEAAALAGMGEGLINFVHADGTPLDFNTHCSVGFRIRRLVLGETLADVVLEFNVVGGGAALHAHPYNFTLAALRATPAHVVPGDRVFVPRDIADVAITVRV